MARPVVGSQATSAAHILGLPLAASNLLGIPVRNFLQHQLLFHADHAVVRAAHAHIGLVGGPARQHALVGGRNMGMRPQHRGHAPIQMPAQCHLLAGGLGMDIDHNHLGRDLLQQRVSGVERIVGRIHEDAALQLDHRVLHAACRHAFVNAPAGNARLQIGWPQHAAPALVAPGGRSVHIVDQLALVPDVVAGGQNIRAQIEEVLGKLRRQAKAAGGVFGIDDGELDVVRRAQMADVLAHDPAPRAAEDVADEENVHGAPEIRDQRSEIRKAALRLMISIKPQKGSFRPIPLA